MIKVDMVFLLLALCLIIFLFSPYFEETYYDHDIAGYVYNTYDILKGRGWYYSDWHSKPPGINIIFLSAFFLFGPSFISVQIAALLANILSAFFMYLLARYLLREEVKLYFMLPLFYALLCVSTAVQGHTANTETFLAPFEIAGILFLGLAYKGKKDIFYFISGLALGAGFMIKQPGAVTFIAGLVFILAAKIIDRGPIRIFVKQTIIFTFGFIITLCLFSIYFFSASVFDKFINYTFRYNIQYVKNIPIVRQTDLARSLRIIWSKLNVEIIIFGLFSLMGGICAFFKCSRTRLLILAWFIICFFTSLRFAVFRHHFMQIIAPFVCLSMIGFSDIYKRLLRRRVLTILFFTVLIIPYLHTMSAVIGRKDSLASAFGAKERLPASLYIKQRTTPGDKIFVWDDLGAGAIYFWSGRDNLTRFRSKYSFLPEKLVWPSMRPFVGDYRLNQKLLLFALRKEAPPYIIIVANGLGYGLHLEREAFRELFDILEKDYRVEIEIGGCLIYRRL